MSGRSDPSADVLMTHFPGPSDHVRTAEIILVDGHPPVALLAVDLMDEVTYSLPASYTAEVELYFSSSYQATDLIDGGILTGSLWVPPSDVTGNWAAGFVHLEFTWDDLIIWRPGQYYFYIRFYTPHPRGELNLVAETLTEDFVVEMGNYSR